MVQKSHVQGLASTVFSVPWAPTDVGCNSEAGGRGLEGDVTQGGQRLKSTQSPYLFVFGSSPIKPWPDRPPGPTQLGSENLVLLYLLHLLSEGDNFEC